MRATLRTPPAPREAALRPDRASTWREAPHSAPPRSPCAPPRASAGATPRLCLHAWRLAFTHPVTLERMTVEAPHPFAEFDGELGV